MSDRNVLPIPEKLECYFITERVREATSSYFKEKSRARHEAYVFWAGSVPNAIHAYVSSCIIPRVRTSPGRVSVSLEKLLDINKQLAKRGWVLLCQLHTHPGDFGHSSGDEKSAASYRLGFISIVVPDYGRKGLDNLEGCYVYEYAGNWKWKKLEGEEVAKRFVFEESLLSI